MGDILFLVCLLYGVIAAVNPDAGYEEDFIVKVFISGFVAIVLAFILS